MVIDINATTLAIMPVIGGLMLNVGHNARITPQNPNPIPAHCRRDGISRKRKMASVVDNSGCVDTMSAAIADPNPDAMAKKLAPR